MVVTDEIRNYIADLERVKDCAAFVLAAPTADEEAARMRDLYKLIKEHNARHGEKREAFKASQVWLLDYMNSYW